MVHRIKVKKNSQLHFCGLTMVASTFLSEIIMIILMVPLARAVNNGYSLGNLLGGLISEESPKCTILTMDIEKSIIHDLISYTEFNRVTAPGSPTLIVSDAKGINFNAINKQLECIVGLTYEIHVENIQKWLLPTHHRQIIVIDRNLTMTKGKPVIVHKKHHPIVFIKQTNKQFEMLVACKSRKNLLRHSNLFNLAKKKWIMKQNLNSFYIEKICNAGNHPLNEQHLTVSFFGMNPSLYFKEGNRIEGVDVDIIDTIASHHEFTYDTIVADSWFKFFPNKSIGGSLGYLTRSQASISLQQLFEIAHSVGEATRTMYFAEANFMEAKPKQIPPYFNIINCFDILSWLGTLMSYAFVCISCCIIYWRKEQGTGALSVNEIFQMMFGIMFQEYFVPTRIKNRISLFTMQRHLWVYISMLLSMAFIGNLKTSLILNNYYERTMSISEIFEKDLPFHAGTAAYNFLDSPHGSGSVTNRRLLCLANKKESTIVPSSSSPFKTMSKAINNHGGVVVFRSATFELARTMNIRQGKEHPFILIPEIYKANQWTMAFQKYDPRVEYFDQVIMTITGTGLIDHMFKGRMPYLGMKEQVPAEEKTLVLEHFYAPLMTLAAGLAIGSLVMLAELFKIRRTVGFINR